MTLLAPLALAGLLSLPILVLFYLFRPEPRQQSSTTYFLWKEAAPESQGGKFAGRLRHNPLLWIQLLLLLLFVLFLARPAVPWISRAPQGERLVIVIDQSASMRAGGAFERARKSAKDAVEDLLGFRLVGGTPEVMLISVDSQPHVLVPFTKDRQKLIRGLDQLQQTDIPDQLETMRPFLASLVKSHKATLWLFGDHLPEDLKLAGLQYTSVADKTDDNCAIMSFSVRNPDPERSLDRPFLYARVENFSDTAQQRVVKLEKLDRDNPGSVEALVLEKNLLLPAQSGQTLVEVVSSARLHPTDTTLFRLTLSPVSGSPRDLLESDDVAYCVVPPFNADRVLVALAPQVKSAFLLRAVAAAHGSKVISVKELLAQRDPTPIDLYLGPVGSPPPASLKVRSIFYLAPPPPKDSQASALRVPDPGAPLVKDSGIEWVRQRVEVTDKSPLLADETVLLDSNQGPALTLSGTAGGQPALHWRFPLSHSSLPLSPALPLLVGRFIDGYSRVTGVPAAGSITTTSVMSRPAGRVWSGPLKLEPVVGDASNSVDTPAEAGLVRLAAQQGLYLLKADEHSEFLAVNLFSNQESKLPRTYRDANFEPEHGQSSGKIVDETRYRQVGTPLLALALLLLLIEAAVFLKRGRP